MENKKHTNFKNLLLNRQKTLQALDETTNDAAKVVELDQTRVGRISRMDALQGQAMSQEIQRRRQIELQKITMALNRIERGEFGYCTDCDNDIAIKRLELDPSVSLCINCASKLEER